MAGIAGWRAWYVDGGRYTSRDHDPERLPKDGLLGVVKYLDKKTQGGVTYRHMLSGDDYYLWWRGEWFSNSNSPEDNERRYPGCLIILGKWTTSDDMDRVHAEMAAAKEAP